MTRADDGTDRAGLLRRPRDRVAIPWLAERHAAEIIAVTLDLGQGEELEEVRDRALATGAAARARGRRPRRVRARLHRPRAQGGGSLGDRSPAATTLAPAADRAEARRDRRHRAGDDVAHGDPAGSASPLDRTIRALDPDDDGPRAGGEWGMTPMQQLDYARAAARAAAGRAAGLDDRASAQRAMHAEIGRAGVGGHRVRARRADRHQRRRSMPLLDLLGSLDIIAGAHGVDELHRASRRARCAGAAAVCGDGEFSSPRVATPYLRTLRDGIWFTPDARGAGRGTRTRSQRQRVTGRRRGCKLSTAAAPSVNASVDRVTATILARRKRHDSTTDDW